MKINGIILATIAVCFAPAAFSDQPSYSRLSIWAESDSHIVLHRHNARAWEVAESFVRIVDRQTGDVVSEFETTPFTMIVPISDSQYFAGLSYFQASSYPHGYNFAVFDTNGDFLVKAFVLDDSGHCKTARQSVSQYVHWFNRYEPYVTLKYERNEFVEILVTNGIDDKEPCKFVPGDHSVKIEGEQAPAGGSS